MIECIDADFDRMQKALAARNRLRKYASESEAWCIVTYGSPEHKRIEEIARETGWWSVEFIAGKRVYYTLSPSGEAALIAHADKSEHR